MLIEENFDIKKLTSFKIGGKIAKMIFPETVDEFVEVLQEQGLSESSKQRYPATPAISHSDTS